MPTFVQLLDKGDDAEADRLASGLLGIALVGAGHRHCRRHRRRAAARAPAHRRCRRTTRWRPTSVRSRRTSCGGSSRSCCSTRCGAIATGVLYARRRFAITAAAPIGNTIVMVAALHRVPRRRRSRTDARTLVDRASDAAGHRGHGRRHRVRRDPGRRGAPQRLLAAAALEPARPRRSAGCLRLSAWGVLLHANAGILLGAALVVGSSIAGGVVAYQVAFVFFLAPYAVLAQPILTAFLPELVGDAERGDMTSFAATVRAALDRMAVLVLPVSAVMVALALPMMRVVAFGTRRGHRRRTARRRARAARDRAVPVRRVPAARARLLRAR